MPHSDHAHGHSHAHPADAANPVLVEARRGGMVESRHRGAAAIVDVGGHVQASWGDHEALVLPRSAVKPLQALPLVETGAAEALGLGLEELALACSSHAGEAEHLAVAGRWLARLGLEEGALACGPAGRHLVDNCSGKHLGFLTLARHLKASPAHYVAPTHPVQQRVLGALEQMTGTDLGAGTCAVDGCEAPLWAMPLGNLAYAWARFVAPDDLPPARAAAARRLAAAIAAHPTLIDGPGRFCAETIAATKGAVLVKGGAEGVYCAGLPDYGLGIALKIDDGATRAAEVAMAALLARVGVTDGLDQRVRTEVPVFSRNGTRTGEIRAVGFA